MRSKVQVTVGLIGVEVYFVGCFFKYTVQNIYALLMRSCSI
jgi:hypothetical protein